MTVAARIRDPYDYGQGRMEVGIYHAVESNDVDAGVPSVYSVGVLERVGIDKSIVYVDYNFK